ncbi:hypothetical protein ACWGHM_13585 [Streptomyces sp. NPDC054904]
MNIEVEGSHCHDRRIDVQAGVAVRADRKPLLPVRDGVLIQPEIGLFGANLLDHLPEQPDQVVHQRLERGVVDLHPAARDVVDKKVADVMVTDLVAVNELGHAALTADDG